MRTPSQIIKKLHYKLLKSKLPNQTCGLICWYLEHVSQIYIITLGIKPEEGAKSFAQGYSLYLHLNFAHLWWFAVGVLDWVFLEFGFPVDGIRGLRCGAFWVFLGWGSPYTHKRITLGKKMVRGRQLNASAMTGYCIVQ